MEIEIISILLLGSMAVWDICWTGSSLDTNSIRDASVNSWGGYRIYIGQEYFFRNSLTNVCKGRVILKG